MTDPEVEVTDFEDEDVGDPPAPDSIRDLPDDEVAAIRQAERDADPSVRRGQVS